MKQTKLIAAALLSILTLTFSTACNNSGTQTQTESPDLSVSESTQTGAGDSSTEDLWKTALYTEDTELGGGKTTINVEVTAGDKTITLTLKTDKGTLGDVLLDNKLVEGDQSEYGLFIKVVNGIRADYDLDGAYWAINKDNEPTPTGADTTEIADGENYQLAYTKA